MFTFSKLSVLFCFLAFIDFFQLSVGYVLEKKIHVFTFHKFNKLKLSGWNIMLVLHLIEYSCDIYQV